MTDNSMQNKPADGGNSGISNISSNPATSGNSAINYTFFIIYMAALSAFGSFVNDMYIPSLPSMCRYFDCSIPLVQLGLTFGMLGLGVGQILMGPISDKYGRKPVLFWSLLLFVIAGIISVFSPTIHFFVACRFFQGMGASGGYFLARTLPADVYGGRMLAKTMALIGAINGVAPASAPVLGGLISDRFDWKGVFVFLVIFCVIILLTSFRLKETLPPSRRFKGSLFRAFDEYPGLLRNYRFMVHVLLKGSALGILFAYISSAPFIMQTSFGYSQIAFGLIMGGNSLAVMIGSMLALKFKILKNAAVTGGILLMIIAIPQFYVLRFTHSFLPYEILLVAMLFCLGMIFTVSNTLAMNEGRGNAGSASAILGVAGYIFGAVVSPLVGIGDILHSTAWVFLILSVIVLVASMLTKRIPPDLQS